MIKISNLSFAYRRKPVFSDIKLQFQPGQVYGLLGSNGAGKSSLLRIIAGLLKPTHGQVAVDQHQPFERKPSFLQDVFMVPEEFYLPDIRITDFVKRHAPFYPAFSQEHFNEYIGVFEVPADQSLQQMSYGQKKKVLIAFALATNAKLLLMDEPTNGLDILSKSQFRKILAAALNDQRCIIISTHQVKDLQYLIDHVSVIDNGQILFDQPVREITRKLSFRFAYDKAEAADAIYAESSLQGNLIVSENKNDDETELDLELLYKAIVMSKDKITRVFPS
ncbi:MAG: ABC transporter ATP-binding protein [Chitinophagaceae bacterium]|nr:MAG: ABC transporter ATP-binding protein [Chitinophagaceae bacterium]